MLLSFIVPVFNTKIDYLEKCVNSLINQTKVNFDYEIILINDGSDDEETIDYLNHVKNEKIKIYNKHNSGVSSSRNLGINVATGKFLSFVDSDDYIKGNFLEKAQKYLLNDCDVLYINNTVSYNGKIKKKMNINSQFVVRSKIFKTSFIKENKIFFDENLQFCEHFIFMMTAAKCAKKIKFLPMPLYVYFKNDFNTSAKYDPTCYINFNKSLDAMKPYLNEVDFRLNCFAFFVKFVLPKAVFNRKSELGYKDKKNLAAKILNDNKLNFRYALKLKKKNLNAVRYMQLKFIELKFFGLAYFLNRLIEFVKEKF